MRQRCTRTANQNADDVTAAAGIRFEHNAGKAGQKWLPETMGSGCAFFDADGEFLSSPPDPVWIGDLFDLVERSLLDDKIVEVEYDDRLRRVFD